ncbi:MAG: hypothetical protein AB8B55_02640 [Mariniblastus sp.]
MDAIVFCANVLAAIVRCAIAIVVVIAIVTAAKTAKIVLAIKDAAASNPIQAAAKIAMAMVVAPKNLKQWLSQQAAANLAASVHYK